MYNDIGEIMDKIISSYEKRLKVMRHYRSLYCFANDRPFILF